VETYAYESETPSVYRMKASLQTVYSLTVAVYLFVSYKTVEYLRQRSVPAWVLWAMAIFLGAFGLLLLVHVFFSRVELDRDSVTCKSVLGRRSIRRAAVAGVKTVDDGEGFRNLVLVSEQPGVRNLTVPLLYDFDERWTAWVATLKKLPGRTFGSRKASGKP
jgi:hypothetical protein